MTDTTPTDPGTTDPGTTDPTPQASDAAEQFKALMDSILADASYWEQKFPAFLGTNPPEEFIQKYLPLFAPFTDPAHLEAVVFGAWLELSGQKPRGYNKHHGGLA